MVREFISRPHAGPGGPRYDVPGHQQYAAPTAFRQTQKEDEGMLTDPNIIDLRLDKEGKGTRQKIIALLRSLSETDVDASQFPLPDKEILLRYGLAEENSPLDKMKITELGQKFLKLKEFDERSARNRQSY